MKLNSSSLMEASAFDALGRRTELTPELATWLATFVSHLGNPTTASKELRCGRELILRGISGSKLRPGSVIQLEAAISAYRKAHAEVEATP